MADDAQPASPKHEMPQTTAPEDAETRAARRELKQSSISDPSGDGTTAIKDRPETPDALTEEHSQELKDQITSPKKKRGHDQLDPTKGEDQIDAESVASADSAKDRASRSEPEKKRHRDADGAAADGDDEVKWATAEMASNDRLTSIAQEKTDKDDATSENYKPETNKKDDKDAPQTSASAFAASGFGKLSAGSSPFAGFGGTTGTGFGAAAGGKPLTSFASSPKKTDPPPPTTAPKLSFGGAASASPFATTTTKTNGFGSGLGGSVFGSGSGIKVPSSFSSGAAAKPFQSQKSSKPFGAPDSDVESDDDDGNGDTEEDGAADKDRDASPEKEQDDKAKLKLHKGTRPGYYFTKCLPTDIFS